MSLDEIAYIKSKKAARKADSVQAQLDQAIQDGDQLVEVQQARVDVDDVIHDTLKQRLDSEQIKVKQGVTNTNQAIDQIKSTSVVERTIKYYPTTRAAKAYVTFIDDDGSAAVLDKLLPIFSAKNVPCTIAANVDNQNVDVPFMTPTQLKMLQDDYGWEIANHGYTHVRLDQVSGDDLKHEIVDCYATLKSWGLNVNHIVYPFGNVNHEGINIASQYHRSGFIAGGGNIKIPVRESFLLNRTALGSFYKPGENTYEFYKSKVDDAIANNGWCVFMMHAWNDLHDSTQQQHLSDLIDYCLSQNVEIVNINDAYELYGNRMEFDDRLILSNQGDLINLAPSTDYSIISDDTVNADTLASQFKPYTITITKIHSTLSNTDGFPITNGFLKTISPGFVGGTSYVTQILTAYNGGMFYRTMGAGSTWTPFYVIGSPKSARVNTAENILIPANGFKAFNLSVPLSIPVGVPIAANPVSFINAEIVYSVKRNTGSSITITMHNLSANERDLGVIEWVVKVLE